MSPRTPVKHLLASCWLLVAVVDPVVSGLQRRLPPASAVPERPAFVSTCPGLVLSYDTPVGLD